MRIVLIGMPGVGKGTQAGFLRDSLGLPHISTGDILREAVRAGTALGRKVKDLLAEGRLVPDRMMRELIGQRLVQEDTREGFILEGFPRTQEQVRILDDVLAELNMDLDGVYELATSEDDILRRLGGRRVCPNCAAVYHLEAKPPVSPGVCESCGSALVQRSDDLSGVLCDRLRVYAERTSPVAESYRRSGLLREVDASGTPEMVAGRLREAVAAS